MALFLCMLFGSSGWVLGGIFISCLIIVLIGIPGYSESESCSSALILSRYFVGVFGSSLIFLID